MHLSEAKLRGEIANAVKFVQSTSEVAIAVKFATGELRDDSYYRIKGEAELRGEIAIAVKFVQTRVKLLSQ